MLRKPSRKQAVPPSAPMQGAALRNDPKRSWMHWSEISQSTISVLDPTCRDRNWRIAVSAAQRFTFNAWSRPSYRTTRLAFNVRGFPPLEPGMASLEPISDREEALLAYNGGECHGALIKLMPKDYEKVMQSDGVKEGDKDQGYEEVMVTAIPYHRFRRPVQAVALRAREHARLKRDACPSRRYMKILKEGAKELGLKTCYQDFLEQHPVQQVPPFLRQIAIRNLVATFLAFRLKLRLLSRIQSWLLFNVNVPSNAGLFSRRV